MILSLLAGCAPDPTPGVDTKPESGCVATRRYQDADQDGFGLLTESALRCPDEPGWVDDPTDCDDGDASVFPGAEEVCNGIDDDCSGAIDDGAERPTVWFVDADGDGYGDDGAWVEACETQERSASVGGDCDDDDATVHPGAAEALCDGVDNDCAGGVELATSAGVAFGSLQEAVDNVLDGRTIEVCPGTWVDHVVVPRGRALQFAAYSGLSTGTVVSGGGVGPVFSFHEATTIGLSNLTVTEGQADEGGCIYSEARSLVLDEVTLTGCGATGDGGALMVSADPSGSGVLPTVEVIGGHLSLNEAGGSGGAIAYRSGGDATVTLTLRAADLSGNTAGGDGGAIVMRGMRKAWLLVYDSVVSENEAGGGGCAVSCQPEMLASITLEGSTVDENTCPQGPVFDVSPTSGGAWVDAEACTFSGNQTEGAGVFVLDSVPEYTWEGFDLTFDANTAACDRAAAIEIGAGITERFELGYSWVTRNGCVDGAGAVSVLGVDSRVDLEWIDFGADTMDNLGWDLWTLTEGAFYGMGPDSVLLCDPECSGLW